MHLSILIAAYNVEVFIEKCIASCYDAGCKDLYEIVMVDDGSTDRTNAIVKNLQNRFPNLKLIIKKNSGLGAARNTGIEHATGDYVWMIDGDDFLETGTVAEVLQNIQKERADMYVLNYQVTDESGKILYRAYPPNYITKELTGSDYYLNNTERNYTWQYVFKRSLFTANHIVFKERINMQDSEILPRVLYYVHKMIYIDRMGYNYVQYQGSFTNTHNPEKRYRYFQSIIEVRDSLRDFGEEIKLKDPLLYKGIQKKLSTLNGIVFNHLVFYKYHTVDFRKNIILLKEHGFYPLKNNVKGNMKLIQWGINNLPLIANWALNILRK